MLRHILLNSCSKSGNRLNFFISTRSCNGTFCSSCSQAANMLGGTIICWYGRRMGKPPWFFLLFWCYMPILRFLKIFILYWWFLLVSGNITRKIVVRHLILCFCVVRFNISKFYGLSLMFSILLTFSFIFPQISQIDFSVQVWWRNSYHFKAALF